MIDICAAKGPFPGTHPLALAAVALLKSVEQVPNITMFRKNTDLQLNFSRRLRELWTTG